MAQQIPVAPDARADAVEAGSDAAHAITEDLAYRRLGIVNVVFVGPPGAGDRGWVLVDAGPPGTATAIRDTAGARFGTGARPAAILLTHGHFNHVGVLEDLAREGTPRSTPAGWKHPISTAARPIRRRIRASAAA
ncbi:hypothetical protein LKMONMHP_4073 [Methylobacterium organophilum]|uniref:Metallo-beta-lactamase domain-containing protein n=1 Tax=Methylobacterium organophilum TaxID=410 RepID=A0ABQ4TEQ7_METOR|nr:hypothetical protein LKMONMHP_4073 [Methylobacterium organophilum]